MEKKEEPTSTDSLERALVSRLGDAMVQHWGTEGAQTGATADAELSWFEHGSPRTERAETAVPALHRHVDRGERSGLRHSSHRATAEARVAPVAADASPAAVDGSANRQPAHEVAPRRRRFVLWGLLFVALFTAGFLFARPAHWLSARHGLDNRVAASGQPPPAAAKKRTAARLAAGQQHAFGWVKVPSASYYRVRFFHDGREVFEAERLRPRVVLPSVWRFRGRTHRLEAGPYRWVVQAGYGSLSARRYGRTIVSAEWFVPAQH
jgi:hypothetical protein